MMMINRTKFISLLSGGLLGTGAATMLPKELEAEEEFVPVERDISELDSSALRQSDWWSIRIFDNYDKDNGHVNFVWSEDGSLWLIHSNGKQKKLI